MRSFKIKHKITLAILMINLVLPLCVYSQESDLGNWMIYIGNKKLEKGFNIHNEIQYRNYNAIGDLEQLLIRTGVGYNLTENNNNILLGYGYILSENYINDTDEKKSVEEHRIFQQFTTKQNSGKVGISHRYRVEERFVESDFKMRFRYFLGLKIPLQNKEEEINSFYLSAYNEVFLNAESSVFDRNRVYGGLGYQFSKDLKFELGYMNQFFESSSRDQINLIAFINF
ncbi:DUF2490 domain-containing protein [uncultured Flavobacterium sp.]|uniref:DUF2490 domain-containing protein n=1 Tax=uncultured Flavobacterium sp. TaxID=165435 RepID=UPI0030EF38A5|tara:strand:- start:39534 stop:40217 length:684 start_codon:yes stop_codon:yes gene_type:complete